MLMRGAIAVVAETARFEEGTQIWRRRTEDSLNLGGRKLKTVEIYLLCWTQVFLLYLK